MAFANHAKIRIGTIDLINSKEYDMPIQIGSTILRNFELFTENVEFLRHLGNYRFIKANLQFIIINKRYNPFEYILKEVVFEYILAENLELFLNEIIPLLNWGINNHKDIDLILLFSLLLCKKEIVADKNYLNHKYPYLSKYFLDNLNVKQNFEFESRVGRDDYAYENTCLSLTSQRIEEYYCVKLIAKELAEKNFSPIIQVHKNNNNVEISYVSMFDNNAFRESSREYTEEECNRYKKRLIDKYEDFYNIFWQRFTSLLEQYESSKSKQFNNWDIKSIYDPT